MSVDVSCDINKLPENLEAIADEIKVWNTALSDAEKALLEAKLNEDVTVARVSLMIRQNPLDYGMAKPTEDGIKQTTVVQPEVVQAAKDYIEAKVEHSRIRAIVEALDAKRSTLKYQSQLVEAGFIRMA